MGAFAFSTGSGGGGGGSPGGTSPQLQFNNGGSFGGSANLEFDAVNAGLRGLTGLTRGFELFNTADITTNTERLRFYWTSNVAAITTDTQGTGTQRELTIGTFTSGSGRNRLRFFGSGATTEIQSVSITSAVAGSVHFSMSPGSFTASTGIQTALQVAPTVNQSGTAGFTGLLVNATVTSTGSGSNWLFQTQTGGVLRAAVATNGQFRLSSGTGQVDFTPNGNSITISPAASSTALTAVQLLSGTMATNSSGTYVGAAVVASMNQSATAGYTALQVNITETAVGSGAKRLLDCQVAGASRFAITNVGIPFYTPSATQSLLAANAILADRGYIKVQGNGGAVTLTSAPTIAAGTEGEVIFIVGQSNTNTVTVQDRGTLASSNLRLGATTRTLGNGDVLALIYDGTLWSEMYFANNL